MKINVITCLLFFFASMNASAYESTYKTIQWNQRGNDSFYCLDICDEQWNIYSGFQAIYCGENFYSWSPQQYFDELNNTPEVLSSGKFNWRVWSPSGYGGDGFEGSVTIGCQSKNFISTQTQIQWGCRNEDTFYCIDIFDSSWNMIYQAADCGDGLHSFSPVSALDLTSGTYHWKVWSPSVNEYWNFQDGFEGSFKVPKATENGTCQSSRYVSTETQIQWGCRNEDTFYCIDIFDSSWNMIYQAADCGDGLHSFSPVSALDLTSGTYHWKVWSPSVNDYWNFQDGFEGSFVILNQNNDDPVEPLPDKYPSSDPLTYNYDGAWYGAGSTTMDGSNGRCENFSISLTITGNSVACTFVSDSGMTISSAGSISDQGLLTISLPIVGNFQASLDENYGTGVWSTQSSGYNCSGVWSVSK